MPAFGCGVPEKIRRLANLLGRAGEIDNIDAVTRSEDKLLHLGVPFVRAVSEMNTRFQEALYLCFCC